MQPTPPPHPRYRRPKQIRIICAECKATLKFGGATGWEHDPQPEDGHAPDPVRSDQ